MGKQTKMAKVGFFILKLLVLAVIAWIMKLYMPTWTSTVQLAALVVFMVIALVILYPKMAKPLIQAIADRIDDDEHKCDPPKPPAPPLAPVGGISIVALILAIPAWVVLNSIPLGVGLFVGLVIAWGWRKAWETVKETAIDVWEWIVAKYKKITKRKKA